MANDRLVICCTKCHECTTLYKWYGASCVSFVPAYNEKEFISYLNEFISTHIDKCADNLEYSPMNVPNIFEFKRENKDLNETNTWFHPKNETL